MQRRLEDAEKDKPACGIQREPGAEGPPDLLGRELTRIEDAYPEIGFGRRAASSRLYLLSLVSVPGRH